MSAYPLIHVHSDDEVLIQFALQGQTQAFDILVIRYHNKLLHLILRFVKSESIAQELTQETFIKAYRYLAQFKQESKFYTWLYRIGVNVAKTWLQQHKDQLHHQNIDDDQEGTLSDKISLNPYDTPEEHMHAQQMLGVIQKALEDLPIELRQALMLREYEEMSYDDIAVVMKCPVGTVRSRIFRAREFVMKALKDVTSAIKK